MGFGPPVVRVILRRLRTVKKSKATIVFAMVVKKCEPFLGCVAPMLRSRQIPCDGSFRQHKAEPPRGRAFQNQYRRKPAGANQPTTVSGLTMTNASRQRDHVLRKTVQGRDRVRTRSKLLI
jgi:hypothetical protein